MFGFLRKRKMKKINQEKLVFAIKELGELEVYIKRRMRKTKEEDLDMFAKIRIVRDRLMEIGK